MVRIRLTRVGAKNKPKYRIVALDSKKKRDGAYIEALGIYDPTQKPFFVKLKKERYNYWLSVGALPSETVQNISKYATE